MSRQLAANCWTNGFKGCQLPLQQTNQQGNSNIGHWITIWLNSKKFKSEWQPAMDLLIKHGQFVNMKKQDPKCGLVSIKSIKYSGNCSLEGNSQHGTRKGKQKMKASPGRWGVCCRNNWELVQWGIPVWCKCDLKGGWFVGWLGSQILPGYLWISYILQSCPAWQLISYLHVWTMATM